MSKYLNSIILTSNLDSTLGTGSFITSGGISVAKKVFIGTDLSVNGSITSGIWDGDIISVLKGGTGVTTSTGTGDNVLSNSPVLVTPSIGEASGTSLNLTGNVNSLTQTLTGSTSGVITITGQPDSGTYNFNLPTASGTVGQVLSSGGGGSTPMTWTNVLTANQPQITAPSLLTAEVNVGGSIGLRDFSLIALDNTVTVNTILFGYNSDTGNSVELTYFYDNDDSPNNAFEIRTVGRNSLFSVKDGWVLAANSPMSACTLTGSILHSGNLTITDVGGTGNLNVSGIIITNSTAASTSPSTGALLVAGGVGIDGDINLNGGITINSTTSSTSTTTGALRVSGGVGIGGTLTCSGLALPIAGNTIASFGPSSTPNSNVGIIVRNSASGFVDVAVAGVVGNYSSTALVGDAIIRAGGNLIIQNGSGASAIRITTSNNVEIRNTISARNINTTFTSGVQDNTFLFPTMSNTSVGVWLGKSLSLRNGVRWVWTHGTDGSTTNRFHFDIFGQDNILVGTAAGNVGIGTSTPNAPLQFATVAVSRKIVLFDGFNNDNQFYGFGINNNTLRYQVDTTAASHVFYTGTSSTTSNELFRIAGNGNIGIGTSTPTARLDISGASAAISLRSTAESQSVFLYMSNPFNGSSVNKTAIISQGITSFSRSKLHFCLNNVLDNTTAVSVSDARLTIDTNGNVGIGITSPNAPLQFAAVTASRKIVLYDTANNDHLFIGFGVNDNTLRYQVGSTLNSHVFYAGTTTTTSNELFRINGNGTTVLSGATPTLNFSNTDCSIYRSGNTLHMASNLASIIFLTNSLQRFLISASAEFLFSTNLANGAGTVITPTGSADQIQIRANGLNSNNGYFYYNSSNISGTISDRRIKNNITTIPNDVCLNFISLLTPRMFEINNVSSSKQAGFIAQEILENCTTDCQKSIVSNHSTYSEADPDCPLIGISDRPLVAYLVGAVKQLKNIIENLQVEFTEYKNLHP
jgi:ribosomal protein L31